MTTLTKTALTALIALVLGSSYLLDGPSDIKTTQMTADAVTALPAQHIAMQVTR